MRRREKQIFSPASYQMARGHICILPPVVVGVEPGVAPQDNEWEKYELQGCDYERIGYGTKRSHWEYRIEHKDGSELEVIMGNADEDGNPDENASTHTLEKRDYPRDVQGDGEGVWLHLTGRLGATVRAKRTLKEEEED